MNKHGAQNAMLWVVIVLAAGFLLYQQGFFEPSVPEVPEDGAGEGALPSDLQCTIEMSFKDALATSERAVPSALWYAFAGDGSYFDSGTAGATSGTNGTASFTANVMSTYDIWAYTTGESGYIAKKTTINTGNSPKKSLTIALIKRSGFTVSAVDDPIDIDQNITGTQGATEEFRVKWKLNVSNAGSLAPILFIDTNSTSTCVEDVTISKADSAGGNWAEITCPNRISPRTAKHKVYCFKRDKVAYSTDGTIITNIVIKFDGTTACGDEDWATVQLADTAMYLEAGYNSIDGVIFDAENDANADVGVGDTAVHNTTSTTWFND